MTILDPQVISLNVFRLHKTTGEIVVDINFYFTKLCRSVRVCLLWFLRPCGPPSDIQTFAD